VHYDIETGFSDKSGLFSRLTVKVLALLVLIGGMYMAVNYFAPEIADLANNTKLAMAERLENSEVGEDRLYIPVISLERKIVPKHSEGAIQASEGGGKLVLSGKQRMLGLLPTQTVELSPFALLGRLSLGDSIVVDYQGERTVYEVSKIQRTEGLTVSPSGADLTIYALGRDGGKVLARIEAIKKIREI